MRAAQLGRGDRPGASAGPRRRTRPGPRRATAAGPRRALAGVGSVGLARGASSSAPASARSHSVGAEQRDSSRHSALRAGWRRCRGGGAAGRRGCAAWPGRCSAGPSGHSASIRSSPDTARLSAVASSASSARRFGPGTANSSPRRSAAAGRAHRPGTRVEPITLASSVQRRARAVQGHTGDTGAHDTRPISTLRLPADAEHAMVDDLRASLRGEVIGRDDPATTTPAGCGTGSSTATQR